MEGIKSIREGDRPSSFEQKCEADLQQVYDNTSRALEGWNNLLTRSDIYAPPIRRQIARTYLTRGGYDWSSLLRTEIQRIVDLMELNLLEEPRSDNNIRLWLRAVRHLPYYDLYQAIDKLSTWRAMGDSAEAYYYLYVLHVLGALNGSTVDLARAEDLIQQSKTKARGLRNRQRCFEWLGIGDDLRRLTHYGDLGLWDDATDFYGNVAVLARVDGRISEIIAPDKGYIEVSSCALPAFFVPAKTGILSGGEGGAIKGLHENRRVQFYLGLSYDGLRAWTVEFAS